MATNILVMMSNEQVNEALAKSNPHEKERINMMLQHSCSMYDFSGNHIPHPYEKENLLEIISKLDTYIVDSNSNWKDECKHHLDKAFIITPTLSREQINTEELILNKGRANLGNIFSVGIVLNEGNPNQGYVLIDRIDGYFKYCFDEAKLSNASKGKGEQFARQKEIQRLQMEHEKEQIRFNLELELLFSANSGQPPVSLAFLTTRKACDLPAPDKMKYATDKLKANIKQRLPACKHNVAKSKILVEICHRTLLLEDTKIRQEFDDPQKVNVFGDMYILLGAVHIGAKIMSHDVRLARMAEYAGIKCCHVPT